ncbi:MAG: hypothetical protein J7J17_01390 [Hadesarchaea archaeon]|nr:hypothetical protein [Hadesarchaea archaeon]
MRWKIVLGVLVCALSTALILSYDSVSRIGLIRGYREVTLDCPLPEMVREVPRLKVVYDDVSPEEAMNLAEEVFGFVGSVIEIEDSEVGGLKVVGSKKELELYSSGAIIFWNREENFSPLHVPDLPSNEEAVCIAENLIRRMEELELIPPGIELQFEGVGPDAALVGPILENNELMGVAEAVWGGLLNGPILENNEGEEIKIIIESLGVFYRLTYRGFRIWWGDVHISIGENGKILYFKGPWRRIEENGYTAITVTPKEAFKRLKSGRFSLLRGSPKKAVVKDVELVYYCGRAHDKLDYLTPVYLFEMAPIEKGGVEGERFFDVVPATDEPFFPFGKTFENSL